ncbi:MAG: AAA family ATPase [Granulosicoccus sp.]
MNWKDERVIEQSDSLTKKQSSTEAITPDDLSKEFARHAYISDDSLIAALHLSDVLGKPLLIEGEAGVGKTEVAKCLSNVLGAQLIRLQCYEGLDAQHAIYDWDYQRQLLAIQMAGSADPAVLKKTLYSDDFLIKRPLLQAIASDLPVVLLIDEVDRADEEFEALLLEVLSDFQLSIPELGTYTATKRPRVILTSNGVRELSDALRRRCLYHYMDYPDAERERAIVRARLPEIDRQLTQQLVSLVQTLRASSMRKAPGIAETLDWAASLMQLEVNDLNSSLDKVEQSLSSLIKTREDLALIRQEEHGLKHLLAMETNEANKNDQDGVAS